MEPRWSVVLFDLDGTLVNTLPLISGAYQYAVRSVVGIEISETKIRDLIASPLIDNCRTLAGDRAAEAYALYVQWMVDHNEDLLEPFSGMAETLHRLRAAGIQLGVCTEKRSDAAALSMQCAGLAGALPVLTTYEDTPAPKPNPAPLLHGLRQLGGKPQTSAYVGDGVQDVQAARAAGLTAVGVTWGIGTREELTEAGADVVVDTQQELLDFLLGEVAAQT